MNKFLMFLKTILYTSLGIIILVCCESEFQESLYNPNAPKGLTPEITSISPPDGALAGVDEVTITGNNFSSNKDEVMVFFDAKRAQILEATPTQLNVLAPNIFGDSIKIKVAVHKVELFSNTVLYKLMPAVAEFGNLMEDDMAYAIASDVNGNVYVSIEGKVIKKIAPDGTTGHFADVSFLKANGMKMGPGNTIYAVFAAGRVKKIATIAPDGSESTFTSLTGAPEDLDFDANGNIWVTSGKDIYLVKSDKSNTKITSFPVTLKTVRVFNEYLYISGSDQSTGEAKIWRSQIQGETLAAEEVVLDLATAAWLSGSNVLTFTFSEDGDMYLGTDHPNDAVFIYHPDGANEILFPGLVEATIHALVWSEGEYIYAIQHLSSGCKILKIDVGKNGAPYYGRQP